MNTAEYLRNLTTSLYDTLQTNEIASRVEFDEACQEAEAAFNRCRDDLSSIRIESVEVLPIATYDLDAVRVAVSEASAEEADIMADKESFAGNFDDITLRRRIEMENHVIAEEIFSGAMLDGNSVCDLYEYLRQTTTLLDDTYDIPEEKSAAFSDRAADMLAFLNDTVAFGDMSGQTVSSAAIACVTVADAGELGIHVPNDRFAQLLSEKIEQDLSRQRDPRTIEEDLENAKTALPDRLQTVVDTAQEVLHEASASAGFANEADA